MPGRKERLKPIFGPIIGCARPFGADGATRRDLHQRVGLPALSVFCFLLLPVLAWPGVRADSSHIQKAVELISKGDMKGAEREARLSMADPASRPLASATLGAIRLQQKRYEEGAAYLRTAIRLNPQLVGARISLGDVYVLQGKRVAALEQFQEALRLDPANRNARFTLAQLERATGNYSESLKTSDPIVPELRRSAEGILLLASDYTGLKRTDQLRSLVPDWQVLPAPGAPSTDFASLLVKGGLVPEATAVLEKARLDGAASFDLYFALAGCYISTGDPDKASQNYEAALSLKADCVPCLLQLARIADRQKGSEKALAYLIRAKRLRPEDPETLFEFGKVCLERDLRDDAIEALQRAVELRPDDDSNTYVLGSAYVSKKQYVRARTLFAKVLAKHPNDPVINYAIGSVFFLEVNLKEAEKYLQRSIAADPKQTGAYYYLGLVAARDGQDERAASLFQELVRRNPDYSPGYEALGSVLLKQKKYPEAQQALERAIELNPDSAKSHYQLGMLLSRTGKQQDGHKELALAEKLEAEERTKSGQQLRIISPH